MAGKTTTAAAALTHPRDRRMRQLQRRGKRAERLAAQKQRLRARGDALHLRFLWFREQCLALFGGGDANTSSDAVLRPSPLLTRLLARAYVARHDGELEALRALGRNAPHGRLRQLQALRQADEDALYSTRGLQVPRLASDDGVHALTRRWDGGAATLLKSDLPRTTVTLTRDGAAAAAASRGCRQQQAHDKDEVARVAALLELLQRLSPVSAVSAAAAHMLPRRLQRQRAAATATTTNTTQSVKRVAATARDVRARAHARDAARQQQRQHAARQSRLQRARTDGDDDDDSTDEDEIL